MLWLFTFIFSIETWTIIVCLLVLARIYIHRKWQYLKNNGIPHDPPSIWKLGHFLDALSTKNAFEYDNQCKAKYGNIYGLYSFTDPSISIHDPELLRQVCISDFQNFSERQKSLVRINGTEMNNGLTASQGMQWKRTRATMTPTFSISKIKQMTCLVEWCADNAVAALQRKLENGDGTFNSKLIFSRMSLDTICSVAFSTQVNSQDDSVKEPEISWQARNLFSGSHTKPLLLFCIIYPPFERFVEKLNSPLFAKESLDYFKQLAIMLINKRKIDPHWNHGRVDLLKLMTDAEISEDEVKNGADRGMTRTEIIGNAMLMIVAGYETTGNSMSFLAYNFAQHPEIQKKVQAEIDEMVKTHGKFDYEGLNSMEYLGMCVRESVRLYNPFIRNARICTRECVVGGMRIPKGMQINIPTFGLCHDPEYWDEPYEFRPERMRDMSQIDPLVYQPFGVGPRSCIAKRLALMELKLSMAKILHKYTIVPAENTPKPPLHLTFTVSTRSTIDYDLRVIPRKLKE